FEGHRISGRGLLGVQASVHESAALFARTDQFGRGAHSRRLHGQSRGRSFQPSRENSRHGCRRTISNRPRRRSRDGTLPLRKCPALAHLRTRRSLSAIQSLRTYAARARAARARRSEKSASSQQQPGALSFTRSRARSRLAAAILPSKTWGRSVNQCRVENGVAKRREYLRDRSLRNCGEKTGFDGLRRPATLALRVAFYFICV